MGANQIRRQKARLRIVGWVFFKPAAVEYFITVYLILHSQINLNMKLTKLIAHLLFALCLLLPAAMAGQVANDICANAVVLTAAADTTCNPTVGTFAGSKQESAPDSCGAEKSAAAYDNWYKFNASATTQVIDVTTFPPAGGGFQGIGAVVELYDNCGGNEIACGNPNIIRFGAFTIVQSGLTRVTASGLTAGSTYYVRVYNYGDTLPNPGDDAFTICVHNAPNPPANDICTTAQNLTVADTCNAVPGSLDGANQESPIQACGADAPSGTAFDVWYSFQAANANEIIQVAPLGQGQSGVAPVIELYDACGGTQLDCQNPVIFPGFGAIPGVTTLNAMGLTTGTTYYVRVYHYGNEAAIDGNFAICVYNAPPPPANDLCANAVTLTVNDSCVPTDGTVASATQESAPTACAPDAPSGTAYDVWYNFQAENATQLIDVTGNSVAAVIELYDACNGSQLGCANPTIFPGFGAIPGTTTMTATGLTTGTTYWVRVYHYGDNPPADGNMTICVYNAPPPPANDTCGGAIDLTVTPTCTPTQGTLDLATEQDPSYDCSGFQSPVANDVWYSFTAPNTSEIVEVNSQNIQGIVVVYDACGGNVVGCENSDGAGLTQLTLTTLTVGSKYYVRVYDDGTAQGNPGFTICVYDVPVREPNDECASAITIPVAEDKAACTPTAVSTVNATQSAQPTSCGQNAINDDVWYKFVATSTQVTAAASSKSASLQATNIGFALYRGACNGPQATECSQGAAGDSLLFRNLIVGTTYYLRTFTRGGQATGTYNLCVYKATLPPGPANDICSNAITVTPTNTDTCKTPLPATLAGALQENPVDSCKGAKGSATANDVWFKFTAIADAHDIQVAGQQVAAVVALYRANGTGCGPFIECENPRLVAVGGNTFAVPGTTTLKALNLTVGTTYFVRVFHHGAAVPNNGAFTICIFRDSAATTGIDEANALAGSLQIFPNPASSQVEVSFSTGSDVQLSLFNISGQLVSYLKAEKSTGVQRKVIDISTLPKGVYTLQLTSDQERITRKIIKE
jgi:hypothetical protein